MNEISKEDEYKMQFSLPFMIAVMGCIFLMTAISEANPEIFYWAVHYSSDTSYVMFWLFCSFFSFLISIKFYIGLKRSKP